MTTRLLPRGTAASFLEIWRMRPASAMPMENGPSPGEYDEQFEDLIALVLDFLDSKSLIGTSKALRSEVACLLHTESEFTDNSPDGHLKNLYTSKLEALLGTKSNEPDFPLPSVQDMTLKDTNDDPPDTYTPTDEDSQGTPLGTPCSVLMPTNRLCSRPKLVTRIPCSPSEERVLRQHHGQSTPTTNVIFHDTNTVADEASARVARILLPVVYNPDRYCDDPRTPRFETHVHTICSWHISFPSANLALVPVGIVILAFRSNGLEDSAELHVAVDTVLGNRYRVVGTVGKGAFSRVFQCFDLQVKDMVCVKVMNNMKDCLEAGLGEIKVLSLLNENWDASKGDPPFIRLRDYMYFKEHLLIVTELLGPSLKEHSKSLRDSACSPNIIASQAEQLLLAVQYVHSLDMKHCDIKPDNICLRSTSPWLIKLIDFGSAVCKQDSLSSYIQSRWYRAPEVILGAPLNDKIDLWGLGCALIELILGYPIFQGNTCALVLAAQQAVLGPLPSAVIDKSPADVRAMYFTPDGELYDLDLDGRTRGVSKLSTTRTPLAKLLSDHDVLMVDFLSSLLQYDPAKRPDASEALKHPFITKFARSQNSGTPTRQASPRAPDSNIPIATLWKRRDRMCTTSTA